MNITKIVVVLYIHKENRKIDIEIPVDITASELIVGLNTAYKLGMDTSNLSHCYLKTENPIALLKGNKQLYEYGLRNGTIINYV